jgi:hypothetical protein
MVTTGALKKCSRTNLLILVRKEGEKIRCNFTIFVVKSIKYKTIMEQQMVQINVKKSVALQH